jgi:hypothetical protein
LGLYHTTIISNMRDSKLINLLRAIEAHEIHWFQKFLDSPFHNSYKENIRLFKQLKKYHPHFDAPRLTKEQIFGELYPGKAYHPQKMRKLMHGLGVLAEEFMAAMYLKNNPYHKKTITTSALAQRNVYAQFEKGTTQLLEELEALPYRDTHFYKEMHQLKLAYYNHIGTSKQKENVVILNDAIASLDQYYLLQRQQLSLALGWHARLLGAIPPVNTLERSGEVLAREPVFRLYELIGQFLDKGWDDAQYLEVENVFKKEIRRLAFKDQQEIIRILLNYLSGQVNIGKRADISKMFALYQFGLSWKLMFENGQMGVTTFINIVTVGLLNGAYEWAGSFIADYNNYLPESLREDTTNLSQGLLLFHREDYGGAIDLLLNYSFSNLLHLLKSRALLIRAYYEQFIIDSSYYELLIAQTNAFEKFVRRKEAISSLKKESYLNFIQATRTIAYAVSNFSVDEKLHKKIKATNPVVLKSWLEEKVKEQL